MDTRAYLKGRVEIEGYGFVVEKGRQDLVRHEGREVGFVLPVVIVAHRNAQRHNELRLASRACLPRAILEAITRYRVENALPTNTRLDFGIEMFENCRAIYGLCVGKEAIAHKSLLGIVAPSFAYHCG